MKRPRRNPGAIYRTVAGQLFGVLLFFVLLNLLAWAGLEVRDLIKATGLVVVENDPWEKRKLVHPGLSRGDIFKLHIESWGRQSWVYEPLAQFRDAPFSGKFVNITRAGYRKGRTDDPWPPVPGKFNIFVFGNSTGFGMGLPDWQTMPTYLAEILTQRTGRKIAVYNFARAYYYSTHEMLLFQRLLMAGIKPDVAVFLDGLNEFYHHDTEYVWSERLSRYVAQNRVTVANKLLALAYDLPAWELYQFVKRMIGEGAGGEVVPPAQNQRRLAESANAIDLDWVFARYRRNQSMIRSLAALHGVRPVFVWQPISTYKYDASYHLFADKLLYEHVYSAVGFTAAAERFKRRGFGNDFYWCADIQQNIKAPLYIDAMHYTARLSRLLAGCIADKSRLAGPITVRPRQ